MTLVKPSLDLHNMYIFIFLLMFAIGNIKIGATKHILLDSGFPRGEGGVVRAWAWFVVIV